MTIERQEGITAFVLHRRQWSETSLIVQCFTPHDGLVDCVAKGARRPKSALRAALHPFTKLHISFRGASTGLKTLTGAETIEAPYLFAHLRLMSALYLNELLVRLLPTADVRLSEMFKVYEHSLKRLQEEEDTRWALRDFEKAFLQEMGYGLDFSEDGQRVKINPNALYSFSVEDGIIKIAHYAGDNPKEGFMGEVILALGKNALEAKHLNSAKRLLQTVLHYHLGQTRSSAHRTLVKLRQEQSHD